jgi:hypothetical protein
MKTLLFLTALALASTNAPADFSLATNGKYVVCFFAQGTQSWTLNAKRSTIRYSVEGENEWLQPVTKIDTDGKTFASFATLEGVLNLADSGDTFQVYGEPEARKIYCR